MGTITKILTRPAYGALALGITAVSFVLSVWLPNIGVITQIIGNSSISLTQKVNFLISLLASIYTNFTFISASYTIAIAILLGLNIALLTYYIRSRQSKGTGGSAALSIGGFVSGIFGIGCAACGTFILTSLLSLFGVAGLLAFLPLGGEEFGFLAVGLLAYSVYMLTKKINEPLVCKIEQ
ncbi:MAG: hypothetical protein ACJKTH_02020 [Patescibacteria group bacterium UBA2163]